MDVEDVKAELGKARHDLKNLLTALNSGCMLIEARLDASEPEGVRELLVEVRAELERAGGIVEHLRAIERDVTAALLARSRSK